MMLSSSMHCIGYNRLTWQVIDRSQPITLMTQHEIIIQLVTGSWYLIGGHESSNSSRESPDVSMSSVLSMSSPSDPWRVIRGICRVSLSLKNL